MIHQPDNKFTPVLTIAGSDNSGGAGIQADLKTFMAHGCYGLSAVAAITAQNTMKFAKFTPVSPELLYEQIKSAVHQCVPLALKTGMLAAPENILIVQQTVKEFNLEKLVIDPVLKSSTKENLISGENGDTDIYLTNLQNYLIPLAFAITPNKMEAELLTGIKIESYDDVKRSAKILYSMGAQNVIIKGGHLDFDEDESVDILYNGKIWKPYTVKKLKTDSFHGTGCTFSASLCSCLAKNIEIETAVEYAKYYTLQTMKNRQESMPNGILNHNVETFMPLK